VANLPNAQTSLPRADYADMFGPTTSDRMKIATIACLRETLEFEGK
jgi:urease alpha subunit